MKKEQLSNENKPDSSLIRKHQKYLSYNFIDKSRDKKEFEIS
jgi:hypothetical protein